MFLTRISVSAPVFATMIMAALMVIGSYSFMRLPIEQLPDVDFPVVAVVVSYPGAAPEAVESDIIEPIEESVNTISGIDYIQSTARAGEALVILFFEMDVDSATAMQEVRDRLGTIQAGFPENANDPLLFKFDPAEQPIVSLAVSSQTMSLRDLTALTEDVVEPRLSSIQGVGRASVVGGIPRQLNVLIDPDRLSAFGVGVGEVTAALGQDNQDLPAGSIEQGLAVQSIQVEGLGTANRRHGKGRSRTHDRRIPAGQLVHLGHAVHFLKEVQVVVAGRSIGAQTHVHLQRQHLQDGGYAGGQFHVALGVMNDPHLLLSQQFQFLLIRPDHVVGHNPVGQEADFVQIENRSQSSPFGKL